MNKYNILNVNIDPSVFQHPLDKKMSQMVLSNSAFLKAMDFIAKNSLEKYLYIYYRSSFAQLTNATAPVIDEMISEAMEMFDYHKRPDVFIERSYDSKIIARGIDKPTFYFSTEFYNRLDEKMLWGFIASEIAGFKLGQGEIRFVKWICDDIGILPSLITLPLSELFKQWAKYNQFSYDRATLIATGDFNVASRFLLAAEGAPTDVLQKIDFEDPTNEYMLQSKEFLSHNGGIMEILRDIKSVNNSFLYSAARYIELYNFYKSDYSDFMDVYAEV